jgi:hypothetical protein
MVALLVISIAVQVWLNWKLNPTSVYLNASQADEHRAKQKELFGSVRNEQASNEHNGITHVPTSGSDHTAVQQDGSQIAKGQPGQDVEGSAGNGLSKNSTEDVFGKLNENAFEHPALWREQPTVSNAFNQPTDICSSYLSSTRSGYLETRSTSRRMQSAEPDLRVSSSRTMMRHLTTRARSISPARLSLARTSTRTCKG